MFEKPFVVVFALILYRSVSSLFVVLDVDTDLYKLIMSPQYLTTEHIQVGHATRLTFQYPLFAKNVCYTSHARNPAFNSHLFLSVCLRREKDFLVPNVGRSEVYPFFVRNSSGFGT